MGPDGARSVFEELREHAREVAKSANRGRRRGRWNGEPGYSAEHLVALMRGVRDGQHVIECRAMRYFLTGITDDMSLANAEALAEAIGCPLVLRKPRRPKKP